MIRHKFGKCLVKRRFNALPTVTAQSVIQHTNIDNFFESTNIKSSLMANFSISNYRIPSRLNHHNYPLEEYKTMESLMFDSYKGKFNGYVFERNLEIWRQFWVAIERCEVVVQVVDIRSLDLFTVSDIYEIYKNRKHILLVNKSDLLGIEPCEYVRNQNSIIKNSNNESCKYLTDFLNNLKCDNLKIFFIDDKFSVKDILVGYGKCTFTFVGFPNVGKSSTINNLFKHKRVKVSKTPGKTKYLQSLYVTKDIIVIDTPGIIFPTEDKIALLLYGVLNPNTLMELMSLVDYIIERIGIYNLIQFYKLKDFVNDSRNTVSMNFLLSFHQEKKYDNGKAVKLIVNDFMDGKIKNNMEVDEVKEDYSWFMKNNAIIMRKT